MQVDADFEIVVLRHHRAHQIADLLRSRHADRIGQGNHLQVVDFHERDGFENFVRVP